MRVFPADVGYLSVEE